MFFGNDFKSFFPSEYRVYTEDLINHKWMLLVIGIILSIVGTATKVKERIAKNNKNHNVTDLSTNNKTESLNSVLLKKDFIAEQFHHKTQQFIDTQQGHLKELALKVEWTPLSGGGSNFKTSFLKRINSSRLEVQRSKGGVLFGGVFATVGLGIVFIGGYTIFKENGLDWEILIPVLFGGIFATVGLAMFYWPRPRVFDLRKGWFWAGDKSLAREQDFMKMKYSSRLSDIEAIQIVSERVSGGKGGSYTSWEINLVSKDGQRLNVMDHGKNESIIADAQLLGEFLGVPVWENT
ncbi:MAG: hypothetical protein V7749_07510 [Cocleimonas sp.]